MLRTAFRPPVFGRSSPRTESRSVSYTHLQVVRTGYNRLRGYYIIIRHEGSVQTLYQHLSYIFVRGGETVTQGQTVAAVGSTGLVTGPHLHLEIILDGVRVDPMPSFPQLAA